MDSSGVLIRLKLLILGVALLALFAAFLNSRYVERALKKPSVHDAEGFQRFSFGSRRLEWRIGLPYCRGPVAAAEGLSGAGTLQGEHSTIRAVIVSACASKLDRGCRGS